MSEAVLFISDLHLDADRPQSTALFVDFIRHQAKQARALYILGDFFEAWIGDDDNTEPAPTVKAELRNLTQQGVKVYLMIGNRDFLMGRRFAADTGSQLLQEPYLLDLFGQKMLLMHGDTLCTRDISYQKFRRKVRNPLIKKLFLLMPLGLRRRIAHKMREGSKRHTERSAPAIMDVTPAEVTRVMARHQVTQLIHGHTHRPAVHKITLDDGQAAKRYVLGAWHDEATILVCEQGREPELVSFSRR